MAEYYVTTKAHALEALGYCYEAEAEAERRQIEAVEAGDEVLARDSQRRLASHRAEAARIRELLPTLPEEA